MTQWSKIIEDNRDAVLAAMQEAAREVGEGDGESILRVELNEDGSVNTYWTQENITSDAVHDGTAIRIKNYYGGEYWSEDWADEYDAAADLDEVLYFARQGEKFAEDENA